ncbi:MAG: bifunctional riboflavin kinase/FMN adenylyltransferase [Chloroflexi bacterium]|nr:bifunctional riboflavin kinase/FMN adenylyltransferase [Chloroflexota bacterium]
MPVTEPFASIDALHGPTVAAIGTFDGVHLGHRALLLRVKEEAEARSARSVALVFREQPRAFFRPGELVSYLCDFETRLAILGEIGIDEIVVLEFGFTIQKLSSVEFVRGLRDRIGLRALIVGPGARIGSDRARVEDLASPQSGGATPGGPHSGEATPGGATSGRPGELADIDFIAAPAEVIDGQEVSSSAIREAITKGNCEFAAKMLGRNYSITGVVATGARRGRDLGFPTANVEPEITVVVPENGIYATLAEVDGVTYGAATSIGVRPTFDADGGRTIEAFLLDFDGDLYTKRLRLEFVTRLRSEVAFGSVEQLVEQMNKDVEQTREILAAR